LCSRSSSSDGAVEPAWLIVGRVGKPHGVHGDVLVDIDTDFPERLKEGVRFGLGAEGGPEEFHEAFRVRYHKGRWLLSVTGLRDRSTIESWRGRFLFLPEQALDDLPEGYYYEHHLIGLECVAPGGEVLGTVTAVDPGPGQTRLVVRRGRRDFLVPYVPEIVREVDLAAGRLVVDAPPGLLDDDAVIAG
jgi:16S rRNA processing protein RimM